MTPSSAMRWAGLTAFLFALAAPAASAPLHDPVALNIGLNCQWQARCIAQQRHAMKRALSYVSKKRPAAWRVHQCNRNAARKRDRVDWIGFDNCIRNTSLRAPLRVPLKRGRRIA
jgi:hypothetical protein